MTIRSLSQYPVPTLESLPTDIREIILAVQEKAGFIPNVFLTLAHRPDEFRAFFAYHDALMLRDSGLSKAEKEMIVVATSGVNCCIYCFVAHGAVLRIYQRDPLVSDQIAIDHKKADITEKQKLMLDFATQFSENFHASICDANRLPLTKQMISHIQSTAQEASRLKRVSDFA